MLVFVCLLEQFLVALLIRTVHVQMSIILTISLMDRKSSWWLKVPRGERLKSQVGCVRLEAHFWCRNQYKWCVDQCSVKLTTKRCTLKWASNPTSFSILHSVVSHRFLWEPTPWILALLELQLPCTIPAVCSDSRDSSQVQVLIPKILPPT